MPDIRRIALHFGQQTFTAVLHDTPVARALWDALPIAATCHTWGDEIYFDTGVAVDPDATQATVAAGDVAYWPPGRALCLFWGPTPISAPGEIRPASPVAVVGRLEGDPRALAAVRSRQVRVERL